MQNSTNPISFDRKNKMLWELLEPNLQSIMSQGLTINKDKSPIGCLGKKFVSELSIIEFIDSYAGSKQESFLGYGFVLNSVRDLIRHIYGKEKSPKEISWLNPMPCYRFQGQDYCNIGGRVIASYGLLLRILGSDTHRYRQQHTPYPDLSRVVEHLTTVHHNLKRVHPWLKEGWSDYDKKLPDQAGKLTGYKPVYADPLPVYGSSIGWVHSAVDLYRFLKLGNISDDETNAWITSVIHTTRSIKDIDYVIDWLVVDGLIVHQQSVYFSQELAAKILRAIKPPQPTNPTCSTGEKPSMNTIVMSDDFDTVDKSTTRTQWEAEKSSHTVSYGYIPVYEDSSLPIFYSTLGLVCASTDLFELFDGDYLTLHEWIERGVPWTKKQLVHYQATMGVDYFYDHPVVEGKVLNEYKVPYLTIALTSRIVDDHYPKGNHPLIEYLHKLLDDKSYEPPEMLGNIDCEPAFTYPIPAYLSKSHHLGLVFSATDIRRYIYQGPKHETSFRYLPERWIQDVLDKYSAREGRDYVMDRKIIGGKISKSTVPYFSVRLSLKVAADQCGYPYCQKLITLLEILHDLRNFVDPGAISHQPLVFLELPLIGKLGRVCSIFQSTIGPVCSTYDVMRVAYTPKTPKISLEFFMKTGIHWILSHMLEVMTVTCLVKDEDFLIDILAITDEDIVTRHPDFPVPYLSIDKMAHFIEFCLAEPGDADQAAELSAMLDCLHSMNLGADKTVGKEEQAVMSSQTQSSKHRILNDYSPIDFVDEDPPLLPVFESTLGPVFSAFDLMGYLNDKPISIEEWAEKGENWVTAKLAGLYPLTPDCLLHTTHFENNLFYDSLVTFEGTSIKKFPDDIEVPYFSIALTTEVVRSLLDQTEDAHQRKRVKSLLFFLTQVQHLAEVAVIDPNDNKEEQAVSGEADHPVELVEMDKSVVTPDKDVSGITGITLSSEKDPTTQPYTVVCDSSNNTEETLANGELILDITLDKRLVSDVESSEEAEEVEADEGTDEFEREENEDGDDDEDEDEEAETESSKPDRKETPLVMIVDGQAVTDSLILTRETHRQHHHVLDFIRKLDIPDDFRVSNFLPGEYKDKRGWSQPKVLLTKEGCLYTLSRMSIHRKLYDELVTEFSSEFSEMEKRIQEDKDGDKTLDVEINLDVSRSALEAELRLFASLPIEDEIKTAVLASLRATMEATIVKTLNDLNKFKSTSPTVQIKMDI